VTNGPPDPATPLLADLVAILRTLPIERVKQHVHDMLTDVADRADYDRLARDASRDVLAFISARAILAEKKRSGV
jgi:hypothetical protein